MDVGEWAADWDDDDAETDVDKIIKAELAKSVPAASAAASSAGGGSAASASTAK